MKNLSGRDNKVALLDRDGTLIFEPTTTRQIDKVDQLKILPGVIEGLKQLLAEGFDLVMVTNQDGLGTSGYPKQNFVKVQAALLQKLAQQGIRFKRVFVCPHFANANCRCRKPKLGLLSGLAIDAQRSIFIGDRSSDEQMANKLQIPYQSMTTNGNFGVAVKTLIKKVKE